MLLATLTRLARLGRALPSVTNRRVPAKPSAFSFCSIRCAKCRLKTNSATLRALIAPSDLAVCPTSTAIRNFAGWHVSGFDAEMAEAPAPSAAVRRFDSTAWRAGMTVRCLGTAALFFLGATADFDVPLKTSDSQPAWPASTGSSNKTAAAADIAAWRWNQFLPDDSNSTFPEVILFAPRGNMAAADADFNLFDAP